ncbi:hypothetical protein Pfo_011413 [Paulownia fortunei]|nr:hypothetical protein Pfo_011413 [Paulownia fortunei]
MDCQLSTSPLPGIWVIETLARSNQVDVSLVLDLLEKSPQIADDLGRNVRELVSLRILESFLVQGAQCNSVSSASSPKIAFDPSESCEDVLQQILLGTSALNLKDAGPEMWKWDVRPFIAHKRSSLATHALQQLKDAILTGSHPFPASLKDQCGLPVGNLPERGQQVDDDKCNGITSGLEGTDTNTHIGERNDQLISPALANSSYLLHSDLPSANFLLVKRKISATTENGEGKSCKDQIISKNGCKNHLKFVKKYKNDIIRSERELGGNLVSSGVNGQLANPSMIIAQYSERERCSVEKNTCVGGIGLNGPPGDDNNESILSKELVGLDEVLPREKQVPHCDTELPNDKSDEEHGQENEIEQAKGDKEGVRDLKSAEDLDKFEPYIQVNVPNGEGEENIHISGDSQCTYSQDSSATNWGDLNMLADISSRIIQSSEILGCSLGKRTCPGDMGQNGLPGDWNTEFTSSKGFIGPDEVLHHGKEVCHHDTKASNENFDVEEGQEHDTENAGDKEGFQELKTTNEYMNRFGQNVRRNVPNLGDAEDDVDISSDSDGYHDERTDITSKKNAFLSSQCTYSQGSAATIDWRELNVCVKCNKGGKLLVCSTKSCLLVIHESCLGSDASFGTGGKFYCPFCAYSQAISKYMDIKKRFSLTRKDFATFVCLGTRKELKKQPCRFYRIKHHHLEQDDGLHKNNELNNKDFAKNINNHQRRRKLEYEQAGPSVLSFGDNPPFGEKTVDPTNGTHHTLNEDKKERKNMRHMSQSPKVLGRHQMAALAILKIQGENASCQVPEKRNGSEGHAEIRSKKGVLCSPDTDLPREYKCSPHTESADAQEISEENENSGASKYFIRGQKHKRQYSYPAIPQLRRKRLPWTTAEEETLKEGMRRFCSPHDRFIPWKKILEFGAAVFQESRSTIDLKDKWRNLCKASPKS